MIEFLTDKKHEKFSLFPIMHNDIWNEYKKQMRAIWTAEEIDFSNDYNDFITLNENEQHTIKMILAFFSNTDGIVNLNISKNFLEEITINEIKFTYTFQMFIENIHNECYSIMLDTIIKDKLEKENLFNSIKTIPIIKEISEWCINYSNSNSLGEKLIAYICVEGIMFSGAFAIIYWLKNVLKKEKLFMSGIIKSNELISRDEGMHTDFGILIYSKLTNQLPNYIITRIILEAVNITKKFNKEVLKVKMIGINENLMNQYTEYISDRIFVSLGLNKYFKSSNPFSFMGTIGMVQKTNLHESRSTEYQKPLFNKEFGIQEDF
jgi:ribonucleotide reductase beta subunit family protein with ferritin-like domain